MKRAVIPIHGWAKSVGNVERATRSLRADLISCRRWEKDYVAKFAWKAGSYSFPRSVRTARTTAARRLRDAILNLGARGYKGIDLVAHSLGMRVVWNGVLELPWEKRSLVGDIFLFAGAMQAFRSWWGVATAIHGRVFNFSSTTDRTLYALYQANLGGGAGRPAGVASSTNCSHHRRGIHTRLRDVHNIRRPGAIHKNYDISHCIDVVAAGEAPRRKGSHGDWRDDFWWQGTPAFPASGTTWKIRGALTEIVQRALAAVYPSCIRIRLRG